MIGSAGTCRRALRQHAGKMPAFPAGIRANCRICAGELWTTRNLAAMWPVAAEVTRLKLKRKLKNSEPPHAGCLGDDDAAEKMRARLEWEYPFKAATRRKAKSSVTELRRTAEELDEEAEPIFTRPKFAAKKRKAKAAPLRSGEVARSCAKAEKRKLSASEAGTAHHKFLQHVALENTNSIAALETESRRLEQEKILSAEECAVLDLDALADFWDSPAGQKNPRAIAGFGEAGIAVHRKIQPGGTGGSHRREDRKPGWKMNSSSCKAWRIWSCCCRRKSGWWISRRTRFARTNCRRRPELYEPQLKLYARALAKIYSRPVANCWLHFLEARKTVEVEI